MLGAGAVGGAIGGRLFEHRERHGHETILIARGQHHDVITADGLTVVDPDRSVTLAVPVVSSPQKLTIGSSDTVILATKTQQAAIALDELRNTAHGEPLVVCATNGVETERIALRRFERVSGMCVMLPALFLEPGVVEVACAPVTGVLDTGRYPKGSDEQTAALAAALRVSTFESIVNDDIMGSKYRKLLMNMGNAVEAATGMRSNNSILIQHALQEAQACFDAAAIQLIEDSDERARRALLPASRQVGDRVRHGSTWQTLARGASNTESDYLSGEIVLLGRLHGVPTPANELLQRTMAQMAADGTPPGSLSEAHLIAQLAEDQSASALPR